MTKYKALAIATDFWRPSTDYLAEIAGGIREAIEDGDIVAISEKAIATALGRIVNENEVEPSRSAKLIANYWMRIIWGYILGPICRFRNGLLSYLRGYPIGMGSHHKQVVLQQAGLLQALMFGSEGGIDGSNLAYAYVGLPLSDANRIAEEICREVESRLAKKVLVMIVDTDKTYSFHNFHFTPRPKPIKGIHSFGGVITYLAGRLFKFRKRPTPVAVAGGRIRVEESLKAANIANHMRGAGSGKTVWDMAKKFDVGLDEVSWEMLETVKHKPIVIVRKSGG